MRVISRAVVTLLVAFVLVGGAPADAATVPAAPRAVMAAPADRSAIVRWAAPPSNGGSRIDSYAVQRRVGPDGAWRTVRTTTASARSWTSTGLVNGTSYAFRVLAHNARGWSPASAPTAVRPRSVPTAVLGLEVDLQDSGLVVQWRRPQSNGGAGIDSYRIVASAGGLAPTVERTTSTLPTAATPLRLSGLHPGVVYRVLVRAHTAAGFGPVAGSAPVRVMATPDHVIGLSAVNGDRSVALTWAAPEADVLAGRPEAAAYRVETSTDHGATWDLHGTTTLTSYDVTGLANGTTARFRVSARSDLPGIGYGPLAVVTLSESVGTPSAPLDPRLRWVNEARGYVLGWHPPERAGGSVIASYEVEHGLPGGTVAVETVAGAELARLDGTRERFRVRAINDHGGVSAWSAWVQPLPGPVGGLTATPELVGDRWEVVLTWAVPTEGAPVASYAIWKSFGGPDAPWLGVGSSSSPTYRDVSADQGRTMTYWVVATGPTGPSRPMPAQVDVPGPD